MTDAATGPVRAPRQDRSRRTLQRITEAARALLAEGGIEAVTVQSVVKRARASVGSFYARFTGKVDLLLHLDETVWADARTRWEAALAELDWPSLSLEETVHNVVSLLFTHLQTGLGERRTLASREGGAQRERDFQSDVRDSVRGLILPHSAAIRHPDPTLAVDLGLRAVLGALRDFSESTDSTQPSLWDLETERVVSELARVYLSYLGAGEGEAAAPGGVDFFDVWA